MNKLNQQQVWYNQSMTKQKMSKEELQKREAFLAEFRELSEKHGLDFGIYYEFDQVQGMRARFSVIEKTDVKSSNS